jgi:hypothetical protein
VLNLVITISIPGISLFGHLGGFVIGAIAMAALVFAPLKKLAAWQAVALALVTLAMIGMFLYRDNQLSNQTCTLVRNEVVCVDGPGQPT